MERSEVLKHLTVMSKKYGEEIPELRLILRECEETEFDTEKVLETVARLIGQNEVLKLEPLANPRGSVALSKASQESQNELLAEFGITPDELIYQNEKGETEINPLYIAALAEKAQFDGDTPELRVGGDLPEGAEPAVPVEAEGTSLLHLGAQLQEARDQVSSELKSLRAERHQKAEEALLTKLGAVDDATSLAKTVQETVRDLAKPLNTEGYEGGKMPVARKVKPMTGAQALQLTSEERQKLAWGAISTTQGRRSATPVMGRLLEKGLRAKSLDVTYVQKWSQKEPLTEGRWTVKIQTSNVNPNFDTVNIAVLSLLRQVGNGLEIDAPLEVEVKPINLYSQREVGWRAQVVHKNPPKKIAGAEEGLQP